MKPLIPRNPFFRFFTFLFYEIIALPLLLANAKIVFGLSLKGRRNLRALKGKGAVLVCNHVHTLDCTFVALLSAPRKVIFTATAPIFERRVIGPLVHILGAIPVPTPDSPSILFRRFIRETARAVRSGRILCIYPEGELIPYCSDLREFRNGAFLIASMVSAPVVPIMLTYRERKGLWRLLKRRPCLTVTAGEPLWPIFEGALRDSAENLCIRTKSVMEKMQSPGKTGFLDDNSLRDSENEWETEEQKTDR